jgi:glycosyltransferase involved in cell wall biosynthesis
MKVSVAIFAYNEGKNIRNALTSLASGRAADSCEVEFHVLVNGCTDDTYDVAISASETDSRIKVHKIEMADKSNAWNFYVHELAHSSDIHCFADGDCSVSEDAIFKTYDLLNSNPQANGLAGTPLSGRNKKRLASYIHDYGWIYGNFYAVKGSRIHALAEKNLRLPIGLAGEDGYVGNFIRLDFANFEYHDASSVISDARIGYHFKPLSPFQPMDFKKYINRQANYRIRQKQFERLEKIHITALPENTEYIDAMILEELKKDLGRFYSPITRTAISKLQARKMRGYRIYARDNNK